MSMGGLEIHEYAKQLLEAHGERAIVEAGQKAYRYETKGQTEEAETWRHIEAALKLMRSGNRQQRQSGAHEPPPIRG